MTDNSHVLHVKDQDTQGDALILLRLVDGGGLAIGLSHRDDGDIEVIVGRTDAQELHRVLGSLLRSQE